MLLSIIEVTVWSEQRSNMYRYHENIKRLRTCMLFSLVTEILTLIACAGWRKTAEWVAMMGKCGSRHTVISLSISTLGFNYFADAHTIPSLLSLFTKYTDNCGSYSNIGTGKLPQIFFLLYHIAFFGKGHLWGWILCTSDAMYSNM